MSTFNIFEEKKNKVQSVSTNKFKRNYAYCITDFTNQSIRKMLSQSANRQAISGLTVVLGFSQINCLVLDDLQNAFYFSQSGKYSYLH
jgi:hypothetical protein